MALFVLGCGAGEKEGHFWRLVKLEKIVLLVFLCFYVWKTEGCSFYMMVTVVNNKHCVKLNLYRLQAGFVI